LLLSVLTFRAPSSSQPDQPHGEIIHSPSTTKNIQLRTVGGLVCLSVRLSRTDLRQCIPASDCQLLYPGTETRQYPRRPWPRLSHKDRDKTPCFTYCTLEAKKLASAFFVKEYFPVPSSGGNQCKTGMPPFGILANHKIKMCHNSMKK